MSAGLLAVACSHGDAPPVPDLSYVRSPTEQTDKLIVFVHGFGSNAKAAWKSDRTGAYWPELITKDADLSTFAIMTASYSSPILHKAGTIEQAAVALGTALSDEKIYTRFSQVVFIAHSTGGLIVRRMLVRLLNSGDEQAVRRVAIVFTFATPTSGAPRADLVRWLSANPQTRDLDASEVNTLLQALDNDWEGLLRQRIQRTDGHPRVFCGYELLDTRMGPIVPALYSKTTCDEDPLPFNRDHFTLVKPDNDQDAVYKWTKNRLLNADRRIGQVMWTGGEDLGTLVDRLRGAYRDNRVREVVRFSTEAERTVSRLWVPPADYRRDSWGELFQLVAVDHPCLAVKIIGPTRIVELAQAGRVKTCGARTICATENCEHAR
jgi:pimeloyl-ACP methyl ester carboxylesterase